MRRKIAKRIKKQLKKLGCTILDEHPIREPGWKRKQCGFSTEIKFKNIIVCSAGDDELDCYRMALEDILEEIKDPILTKGYENNEVF